MRLAVIPDHADQGALAALPGAVDQNNPSVPEGLLDGTPGAAVHPTARGCRGILIHRLTSSFVLGADLNTMDLLIAVRGLPLV
jgi:hypothetical protein